MSVDISIHFSDPDGDVLSFSASTLPAGLTIDSESGVIAGTLDKAASQGGIEGVYTVIITSEDASGDSISDTFEWTIANPSPTAVDDGPFIVAPLVRKTYHVLNNDTDVDGDVLTITHIIDPYNPSPPVTITIGSPVSLSSGTVVELLADSSLSITYASTALASDAFDYIISDGDGGTDTATVTFGKATDDNDPASESDIQRAINIIPIIQLLLDD